MSHTEEGLTFVRRPLYGRKQAHGIFLVPSHIVCKIASVAVEKGKGARETSNCWLIQSIREGVVIMHQQDAQGLGQEVQVGGQAQHSNRQPQGIGATATGQGIGATATQQPGNTACGAGGQQPHQVVRLGGNQVQHQNQAFSILDTPEQYMGMSGQQVVFLITLNLTLANVHRD